MNLISFQFIDLKSKRKLFLVIIFYLFIVSNSKAAIITTTGAGNWSAVVPAHTTADEIVIAHNVTLNVNVTATSGSANNVVPLNIKINSGVTLTLNGAFTLTTSSGIVCLGGLTISHASAVLNVGSGATQNADLHFDGVGANFQMSNGTLNIGSGFVHKITGGIGLTSYTGSVPTTTWAFSGGTINVGMIGGNTQGFSHNGTTYKNSTSVNTFGSTGFFQLNTSSKMNISNGTIVVHRGASAKYITRITDVYIPNGASISIASGNFRFGGSNSTSTSPSGNTETILYNLGKALFNVIVNGNAQTIVMGNSNLDIQGNCSVTAGNLKIGNTSEVTNAYRLYSTGGTGTLTVYGQNAFLYLMEQSTSSFPNASDNVQNWNTIDISNGTVSYELIFGTNVNMQVNAIRDKVGTIIPYGRLSFYCGNNADTGSEWQMGENVTADEVFINGGISSAFDGTLNFNTYTITVKRLLTTGFVNASTSATYIVPTGTGGFLLDNGGGENSVVVDCQFSTAEAQPTINSLQFSNTTNVKIVNLSSNGGTPILTNFGWTGIPSSSKYLMLAQPYFLRVVNFNPGVSNYTIPTNCVLVQEVPAASILFQESAGSRIINVSGKIMVFQTAKTDGVLITNTISNGNSFLRRSAAMTSIGISFDTNSVCEYYGGAGNNDTLTAQEVQDGFSYYELAITRPNRTNTSVFTHVDMLGNLQLSGNGVSSNGILSRNSAKYQFLPNSSNTNCYKYFKTSGNYIINSHLTITADLSGGNNNYASLNGCTVNVGVTTGNNLRIGVTPVLNFGGITSVAPSGGSAGGTINLYGSFRENSTDGADRISLTTATTNLNFIGASTAKSIYRAHNSNALIGIKCYNVSINKSISDDFIDHAAAIISGTSNCNLVVTNQLTLTAGLFRTNSGRVQVENISSSSIAGQNSGSYIYGNLRRYINTGVNQAYDLPVGTDVAYRLAKINESFTGVNYLDTRYDATFTNTGSLDPAKAIDFGTPYSQNTSEGIWTIEPDAAPTGQYDLDLYFDDGGASNAYVGLINNQFGIVKRPFTSGLASDWTTQASAGAGSINASSGVGRMVADGFARRKGLTMFSHFNIAKSLAPLPIDLLSYSIECENNVAKVEWVTSSETNNDYFTIWKSLDAINYNEIGYVKGSGNSSVNVNYTWIDDTKNNTNGYYKLSQTDFDGSSKHFPPMFLNACDNENSFTAFFNSNNQLIVDGENIREVTVYNALGQLIFSDLSFDKNQPLKFNQFINRGIYFVVARTDSGEVFSEKLILK